MKKFLFGACFLMVSYLPTSALTCIDLQNNLTKGKETGDVLTLQNFLFEKGLLTVTPNGYFGNGTLSAVKKYQKSVGLSQSGQVFPLTRAAIKKETCVAKVASSGTNSTNITTTTSSQFPAGCTSFDGFSVTTGARCSLVTSTSSVTSTTATTSIQSAPVKITLTANDQRQKDVIDILQGMYSFYKDSYNVFLVPTVSSTSVEICSRGISECDNLLEIKSSLVSRFLSKIPVDPTITTGTGTGYFATRSVDGDITVTAQKADGGANIFATCNFIYSQCSIKTVVSAQATQLVGQKPKITGIDMATFFSGGSMTVPVVIHGTGFSTTSNSVILKSQSSQRSYTIGNFSSLDSTTINATSGFTISPVSCGNGCSEVVPPGGYDVIVKNQGGESNTGYISLKSITAQTVPNSPNASFIPKSTHVKLATFSLSSSVAAELTSLTLHMTASSTLVSKISNLTLTDLLADKIINGGPSFVFTNQSLSDNQSKIYELYVDIADVTDGVGGQIYFTGEFTIKDYIAKNVIKVPVPNFLISVSY